MTHHSARKFLKGAATCACALSLTITGCGGADDSNSSNDTSAGNSTTTTGGSSTGASGANVSAPEADTSTAQGTMQQFINHLAAIEFAEALELSDPTSAGYADIQSQLNTVSKNPSSSAILNTIFGDAFGNAEVSAVTVEDARARFEVAIYEVTKVVDLQKSDGQWLVLVPDDLIDEAVQQGMLRGTTNTPQS